MFTLPDLPYEYNSLEPYIDEQTMKLHHDKHHATYVKNLNDLLAGNNKLLSMEPIKLIQSLNKVPKEIRQKVRNNGGGDVNHSFFWTIMTPKHKAVSKNLKSAMKSTFGGVTEFMEKFTAIAMGRFGSGWAWLVVDRGKLAIMDTPNQDSPLMENKTPILGLDVWEHAYYLKYQNRRVDYITAWWKVVNWKEVEKRFIASMK